MNEEENLKKMLEESVIEITEALKKQYEPKLLFVKDVARILKINQNKANELWNRKDFPRNTNWSKENRTKSIL